MQQNNKHKLMSNTFNHQLVFTTIATSKTPKGLTIAEPYLEYYAQVNDYKY